MIQIKAAAASYQLVLIVGATRFWLVEKQEGKEWDRRYYSLYINEKNIGVVSFFAEQSPSIAVHLPWIFIWGGVLLYYVNVNDLTLIDRVGDFEFSAVYPLIGGWCLVTELSVEVVADLAAPAVKKHTHYDVIMEHRWTGTSLWFEDFQKRCFSLDLTAPTLLAVEQSGDSE